VDLCWQQTATSWRSLRIIGLTHHNNVYRKKSVEITAKEALEDTEESGFIVPLHYDTVREMSLVDSTQMCTACQYLVLNSYKIVKAPWYATGFFKLIVFIAIIVISIVAPPFGGTAGAGLLGSGAAVGAALGFSGLAAIIVGATVNALAAMIVAKMITEASTEVFGEKLGAIIGAVASLVAMQATMNFANGGSWSTMFNNMTSATGLLSLTNAIGEGVVGFMAASAQGVFEKTQDLMKDYAKQSEEISELFAQNIGYDMGVIDPLSLTEGIFGNFMETPSQFLGRTLLTGSDIAELTHTMLSEFASLTTATPLALTTGD